MIVAADGGGGLRHCDCLAVEHSWAKSNGWKMNKIDTLIHRRADERRRTAQFCVSRIIESARGRGIDISVVGSLAKDLFRVHSDIDLLVHGRTDPARRAMIEHLVADHLRGMDIPYDLIFASDISPERAQEFLNDCV
jgi:predicted nucleotidyltransferase